MAKNRDLNHNSKDGLTALVDETTNLRTTELEGDERERNFDAQETKISDELADERFRVNNAIISQRVGCMMSSCAIGLRLSWRGSK